MAFSIRSHVDKNPFRTLRRLQVDPSGYFHERVSLAASFFMVPGENVPEAKRTLDQKSTDSHAHDLGRFKARGINAAGFSKMARGTLFFSIIS